MATPASQQGLGIDEAVDRVRSEVIRRLREVENKHNLRIVFACESGSRAWGFASKDSDFDVRFIFVRPIEHYLKLLPPKDAFDLHQDQDFDLAGWDIRKTAELMRRCNPPLMEWLDSPIIYEADDIISPRLIELRDTYFDSKKAAHHYLSLASGVWHKYIAGKAEPVRKKYLYVVRPLACIRYITLHGKQPPTLFDDVLAAIDWSAEQREALDELLAQKREAGELGKQAADPLLTKSITRWLDEYELAAHQLSVNQTPTQALDELINLAILGEPEESNKR